MPAYATLTPIESNSGARVQLTRDDVMTAREVADLLKMPVSTVCELARRGELPASRLGKTWRFMRPRLEGLLGASGESLSGLQRPVSLDRELEAGELGRDRHGLFALTGQVEGDCLFDGFDQLGDGVSRGKAAGQLTNLGPAGAVLVMYGDV